jgi:hypothetical protein
MEEELRKSERKRLYAKLVDYASKRLRIMVEIEGEWSVVEISRRTGIPQNRLSEIRNYQNYKNNPLNPRLFGQMIKGGIVSIDEVQKNVDLTEREARELELFRIYEDRGLQEEIRACVEAGLDPVKILRRARLEKTR